MTFCPANGYLPSTRLASNGHRRQAPFHTIPTLLASSERSEHGRQERPKTHVIPGSDPESTTFHVIPGPDPESMNP